MMMVTWCDGQCERWAVRVTGGASSGWCAVAARVSGGIMEVDERIGAQT